MKTRINIVDGDINTEVGSVFVDNSAFAELREFHISQIKVPAMRLSSATF
uniref:Uncharacterized protein n=1 Tax=Desertifilum tharense IPPAS B-1220 TaxID=1781255 RepID=A0ACD5GQS0_9CYAN